MRAETGRVRGVETAGGDGTRAGEHPGISRRTIGGSENGRTDRGMALRKDGRMNGGSAASNSKKDLQPEVYCRKLRQVVVV